MSVLRRGIIIPVESEPVLYTFIENPIFMRHVAQKASMDIVFAIQADLIRNPRRGDIVQGTHGARKARIANPGSGRGKRGSYRYMYLFLEHKGRIHLLYLYGKNETEDLSPSQKKIISQVVDAIREQERGH